MDGRTDGWLVGWFSTALSAQIGYHVMEVSNSYVM